MVDDAYRGIVDYFVAEESESELMFNIVELRGREAQVVSAAHIENLFSVYLTASHDVVTLRDVVVLAFVLLEVLVVD